MTSKYRVLPAALIVILGLVLGWLWYGGHTGSGDAPGHRPLALAERPEGGDFRLHAADGPLALSDLRGRVVLIYFGYTWCPDICPTNLSIIALGLRQLMLSERERVQVLFVSVDPARDTPERLRDYAAHFHPDIIGLTGSETEIAGAAALYGAAYRRAEQADSAMGYVVDHSAYTYLVDPDGRLVETLDHATPAETIVARIRAYLPADG